MEAARSALTDGEWAGMPAAERAEVMAALLALVYERSDDLANLITAENGCPILFSHFGQVGASAMVLDYFTNLTRTFAFEEVRPGMIGPALVRQEPVGVVAGIIPWNVPLFITMLKFAPALASGSAMVLKPAPETPIDALVLAELVEQAGIPAGVLNIVPAGREVGEYLVTARRSGQGVLHRLHRGGPPHRLAVRRAPPPLHPRAGRQVRSHPPATTPTWPTALPSLLPMALHDEQRPGLCRRRPASWRRGRATREMVDAHHRHRRAT